MAVKSKNSKYDSRRSEMVSGRVRAAAQRWKRAAKTAHQLGDNIFHILTVSYYRDEYGEPACLPPETVFGSFDKRDTLSEAMVQAQRARVNWPEFRSLVITMDYSEKEDLEGIRIHRPRDKALFAELKFHKVRANLDKLPPQLFLGLLEV